LISATVAHTQQKDMTHNIVQLAEPHHVERDATSFSFELHNVIDQIPQN
jgi:hypothetical protein